LRYKILVVDDEPDNQKLFRLMLEREGYSVFISTNAREGLLAALDSRPDLILTDVVMPGADGLTFVRQLKSDRRTAAIPVLMISGQKRQDEDQAEGMDHGADDYVLRPFSQRVLMAKVRSVLRRTSEPGELVEAIKAAGLTIDDQARTVAVDGKPVELTRKEYDLLTTLLRKRGRVLTVPYLLETVWGYDPAHYNDPHTLQVHLSSLRRKLGTKLAKRIVSVPGMGYRFQK
jgi:DNA-binding response OmpR family regulator